MKLHDQQIRALVFLMITICFGFGLGCAQQMVWVKPGASTHDFNVDKYACMQEAQQPDSTTFVNKYGGFSDSGMITNWNLFNACMNAKSWHPQTQQQQTSRHLECEKLYEEKKAKVMEAERELQRLKNRLTANIYDEETQRQKQFEYGQKFDVYKKLLSDSNAELDAKCR